MITIRKLASLKSGTRQRKCVRLLEILLQSLRQNDPFDFEYLVGIVGLVDGDDGVFSPTTITMARDLLITLRERSFTKEGLVWPLADLVYMMHLDLHMERADWDFIDRSDGRLDRTHRTVMPFTVVLDRIRSPFNVGSIFRTADSFGVRDIQLVSPCASPEHPRSLRTARGCTATIGWETRSPQGMIEALQGKQVFALELGGLEISSFPFPNEGVMIVGSEELGTSGELLQVADDSLGRVSIPLAGSKGSLNVSVAFGIAMHAWYSNVSSEV